MAACGRKAEHLGIERCPYRAARPPTLRCGAHPSTARAARHRQGWDRQDYDGRGDRVATPTAVHEPWWCSTDLRTPSAMRSAAVGADPTPVTPTLSAQEIDAQQLFDRSWSTVRSYLQDLLEWAGAESVRRGTGGGPGLDELLALRTIAEHVGRRGTRDRRLRPDRRDRSSPGPPLDATDIPRPCAPRSSAARPLGGARPASGRVDAPGACGRPRRRARADRRARATPRPARGPAGRLDPARHHARVDGGVGDPTGGPTWGSSVSTSIRSW